MNQATLLLSVENATCEKMEDSKKSNFDVKSSSQKPWPPVGIKWYYSDDFCAIAHGDCREILTTLPKVDLVLTDPPYDIDATHSRHLSTIVERRVLDFDGIDADELTGLVKQLLTICNRWCIFTCDWHHILPMEKAGLPLVRFGIWIKPNGSPQFTGDRPGMGWEPIAIFHNPGKKRWNGGGKHAVWEVPIEYGLHPTQKPIHLYTSLLLDFSDANETILDPFMGSGTTLRAAKDLGRKAIGIEIEERYCEIAANRMAQEVLPLA